MLKPSFRSAGLLVLSVLFLAGCNDVQRFNERMKLNEAQALQAKPVLESYLSRQETLFSGLQKQMPSPSQGGMGAPAMGGGAGMGDPGMGRGSDNGKEQRPDTSALKEKLASMNKPFEENDAAAAKALEAFLNEEQVTGFKQFAKEYRQEKMKEFMEAHRPGGGPGGPGGGPMGGGMGRGGNF